MLACIALGVFVQAHPTAASFGWGLVFGVAGELLRICSIGYSGQITRSLDPDARGLVTAGPYSIVRNPLYVGNVLNSVGVLLACSGGLSGPPLFRLWIWGISLLVVLYASLISLEEEFLSGQFGQEYWEYHRRVPAFLPRSLVFSPGNGHFSWRHGVRWELTTLMWWSLTWAWLYWMSLKVKGAA